MMSRSDFLSISVTKSFFDLTLIWEFLSLPYDAISTLPAASAALTAVFNSIWSEDLKLFHPLNELTGVIFVGEGMKSDLPGRFREVKSIVDVKDFVRFCAAGLDRSAVNTFVRLSDFFLIRKNVFVKMGQDRIAFEDVFEMHGVGIGHKDQARTAFKL